MAALLFVAVVAAAGVVVAAAPRRILVDTDMDMDDVLALLYILKHNRSEFDVKVGPMSSSPSLSRGFCGRVCSLRTYACQLRSDHSNPYIIPRSFTVHYTNQRIRSRTVRSNHCWAPHHHYIIEEWKRRGDGDRYEQRRSILG
jgi:hypothetical protein